MSLVLRTLGNLEGLVICKHSWQGVAKRSDARAGEAKACLYLCARVCVRVVLKHVWEEHGIIEIGRCESVVVYCG